jgi:Xaa-Pro aminopeptidase
MTVLRAALFGCTIVTAPLAQGQAQIPDSEYASRRAAFAAKIDSGVVLTFGAREPRDHYPAFYQLPEFRYLTGFLESDAAMVLVKRGGTVTSTLYIPHADPRRALYYGTRLTPDDIAKRTGMPAKYVDVMAADVDSLAATGLPVFAVTDVQSNEFARNDSLTFGRSFAKALAARHAGLEVKDATRMLDQIRAKKSDAEVALLKRAAEISSLGHREALKTIRPGVHEYEVQAAIEAGFRRAGGDRPAYSSIVGSGPNSTVLHYDAGDRVMKSGEVVLMDVASAYQGYTSDVTRTVPVSGVYTPAQRAVYEIVLAAQRSVEQTAKPGTPRNVPWDTAQVVVKNGLAKLGLVQSADAAFDPPPGLCPQRGGWARPDGSCPQWYLFSYHGYGHGVGLDVHDLAQYSDVAPNQFQTGDVFTIEPGIYVRQNVFDDLPDTPRNRAMIAALRPAVEKYLNVGVRIEDTYALTRNGLVRLSAGAPREIAEIEAAMRKATVVQ